MTNSTILIVEDHDILREGLHFLLETEGYQVMTADNGAKALASMESACPDLILSDISMPVMDGYAFYSKVRERPEWVTIPFIFLTARGERDDLFASKKLGVEDYLVKPVDRQELVTTIRSRLDRSHQLMLAQLHQAYEASLIMLANAIELRDQYTRGHVERVMHYTEMIANNMGLSPGQASPLRFGSILHDIGKIYIKETILCKAGPLSNQEWDEMKRHPIIGAELVKKIPYLVPALPIIRHHHERWDGKGYPDGLAGDEIPLGARIVSVADSFDAMTTVRVYQAAVSSRQALVEIQEGRLQRYDPNVVDAFTAAWKELDPSRASFN
jgi:putative two-component system response regulator